MNLEFSGMQGLKNFIGNLEYVKALTCACILMTDSGKEYPTARLSISDHFSGLTHSFVHL